MLDVTLPTEVSMVWGNLFGGHGHCFRSDSASDTNCPVWLISAYTEPNGKRLRKVRRNLPFEHSDDRKLVLSLIQRPFQCI